MNKIKFITTLSTLLLTSNAWSLGMGVSSYPMLSGKKLISSEFTGITSSGGGVGLQARYTQKLSSKVIADAGIGISGGERANRFFTGVDFELYPDYSKQPKISVRADLELAKEFGVGRTKLGMAPTISKGFNFWGREAFPYFSMPVGISLDGDTSTYKSTVSANLGINGNLPIESYKHLQANAELQVDVKDSYTSIIVGLSYPLQ
ncbi:hypothetical protein [Halobacteriovorax sp. HLS]|uniref:hypothetical protein n=1 Tax=Halobacteriovorax sp. HLS TaxID=2234000 RepID=UPI000FDA6238|nr:hypothetical protein [Halobacteriovorax sp. HLS]